MNSGPTTELLLCRIQTRLCALPLQHVLETMRPLPVEPLSGAPYCILGVAIIRGLPVPVVDVGRLFGGAATSPTRFVTVRAGARPVALAVDDVLGVRSIPAGVLSELPPLLRDAQSEHVAAIGVLDAELLLVLNGARLATEVGGVSLGAEEVPA